MNYFFFELPLIWVTGEWCPVLQIDRLSEEQTLRKSWTVQTHLEKRQEKKVLRASYCQGKDVEREEFLLKERMKMRKLRAAKKSAQHDAVCDSNISMPHRSSQSLEKAVKRACTSLPLSKSTSFVMAQLHNSNNDFLSHERWQRNSM